MIDKIIFSALLGTVGFNGLFPDQHQPLTPTQLRVKAKEKSISEMCDRKPKSRQAKDLCKRWEKQQGIL